MVLEVKTAFSQQVMDTLPMSSPSDIESMLQKADDTFKKRSDYLTIEHRCDILRNTAILMQENQDSLALQIANEGGKPLTDAKIEVARAIDGMQVCIEHLRTRHGEQIPMNLNGASMNRLGVTQFEPMGVVVAISAFNHPLNLIVHQVAPAIAAGCPVIVKPASTTPLSAKSFIDYLHQSGLPPQWAQLCIAGGKDAQSLATDARVGFFSFIGSGDIGWMLRSKLAPGTRCALEHGGIAPVIIDESANLDNLLPKIIKGGYYHAGQVCVSVQRVFVPNKHLEDVAQRVVASVKKLTTGDPTKLTTDVGPLILPQEVKRVNEWVQSSIKDGAKCALGANVLSETTYEPTVLINPPTDSKVMQHEIFGPVMCLIGYDDIDKAIHIANDVPYSFQASVFSENITSALQTAEKLNAASVMINDHTAFRVDWMPFAGYKRSGHGVGGIPHTMDEMSQKKLIVLNYNG